MGKLLNFFRKRLAKESRDFGVMTGNLLKAHDKTPCPSCGAGYLALHEGKMDTRTCNQCGADYALENLGQVFAAHVDMEAISTQQKAQADTMILCAEILLSLASVWAIWSGNWSTLIGGVLISLLLFSYAIVAKYRAWQVENNRLFEKRAPFLDFLLRRTKKDLMRQD